VSDLEKMKARLEALKQQSFAPSAAEAERIRIATETREQEDRLDRELETLLQGRADAERQRLELDAPDGGPYEAVCLVAAEKLRMTSVFVMKTIPPGAHAAYTKSFKPGKPLLDPDARRALVFKAIAYPDVKNDECSKAVHATLDKFPSLLSILFGVAEDLSGGAAEATRPKSRG
jgi:hypothetical protein